MGCNLEKNNTETPIAMVEEAVKNIAKKITKTIHKIQKNKKDIKVLQIPINPEIAKVQELNKGAFVKRCVNLFFPLVVNHAAKLTFSS